MPTLLTSDGVRIRAVHLEPVGMAAERPRELAAVVAHGFTGSLQRPAVRTVLHTLRTGMGAVALDFRGHGRSSGVTTVGDREIEDVEAAVRWARSLGYERVATLGFSMGGAVVLRHAGLYGGVDAVVSVSAPAWWHYRGTPAMRRLHWLVESGSGRTVSRVWRGTRIDRAGWPEPLPVSPEEAASRLRAPLLVVHGDADPFFPVEHARAIADATPDPKELWVVPQLGHAEGAVGAATLSAIGTWVRSHAAVGASA